MKNFLINIFCFCAFLCTAVTDVWAGTTDPRQECFEKTEAGYIRVYFEHDKPSNKNNILWESDTCNGKVAELKSAIEGVVDSNTKSIYLVAFTDTTGQIGYNKDLANTRAKVIESGLKQLDKTKDKTILTAIVGETDMQVKGEDNTSNWKYRSVDIIPVNQTVADYCKQNEKSCVKVIEENGGNIDGDKLQILQYKMALLQIEKDYLKKSRWKDAEGNFNTARLASDSIAAVVLGTAGGLITSKIVKKNQIKDGFEDIRCYTHGHSVADWGDEFLVGVQ